MPDLTLSAQTRRRRPRQWNGASHARAEESLLGNSLGEVTSPRISQSPRILHSALQINGFGFLSLDRESHSALRGECLYDD